MGLITKEVQIIVSNHSEYYEKKGYKIPSHYCKSRERDVYNIGEKFTVKAEDLSPSASIKLEYECDCCHTIFKSECHSYIKKEMTFCKDCQVYSDTEGKSIVRLNHPMNRKRVIPGVNDIETIYPQYVKFLVNKELAKTYSYGTDHVFLVECPQCKIRTYKSFKDIVRHKKLICSECVSDKVSYPNKFVREFIKQLNVDKYIFEYSPIWLKPFRFDCYFEYNGNKFVIEMDGGIGHGNNKFNSKEKDTEGLKKDILKDSLAKKNDIQVIRIDCRKSEMPYIRKNIINSELNNIFDLSLINWNKCEQFALSNVLKDLCEYYNTCSIEDKAIMNLQKKFNLARDTVTKYLKIGDKVGLCKYDKELSEKLRRVNSVKSIKDHSYKINLYTENGDFIKTFKMDDLVTYLKDNSNTTAKDKQIKEAIRRVCRNERQTFLNYKYKYDKEVC